MHARAAYMEKHPDESLNPLAYRILLIMPVAYRKWATTRLRALMPWVDEWALEEIFAGIGGQGSGDGAIELA